MTENDLLPGMSIPLKSLEEYNVAAQKRYDDAHAPRPNGIACPDCGTELNDMTAGTSCDDPPRVLVRCPKCGLTDSRIQFP